MKCTKIDTASRLAASTVAFLARGSKPSAGEAERSGKRGYCAAFNEALPVQQRLEALHKVYALAFAFSAAHIQRAPLHSAQSYTVRAIARTIAQRPALHCAQRFTASVAQCATLYIPPS